MSIFMRDPRGTIAESKRKEENRIETLGGKKVGYVYNQHGSALTFWKRLEREIDTRLHPASEQRIYKDSTWRPASQQDIDEMVRNTDYALVGVGA